MSTTHSNETIGDVRLRADKRQFGAMLIIASISAGFFRMAHLAGVINGDGATANEGLELNNLIGWLFNLLIGIFGITSGYLTLVIDTQPILLTKFNILLEQTAYISFIGEIIGMARTSQSGIGFIPTFYEPTEANVKVAGSMNILMHFSACFFVYGSVAFFSFALNAYSNGESFKYNAGYYRSRLTFFSILHLMLSVVFLLSGIFIITNFNSGPLPVPIIMGGMVYFPEFHIIQGTIFLFNSMLGLARGLLLLPGDRTTNLYQLSIWFQYLFALTNILTNFSYNGTNGPGAGVMAMFLVMTSVHIFPAFLEYKSRTAPEVMPIDYYSTSTSKKFDSSTNNNKSSEEESHSAEDVEQQQRG